MGLAHPVILNYQPETLGDLRTPFLGTELKPIACKAGKILPELPYLTRILQRYPISKKSGDSPYRHPVFTYGQALLGCMELHRQIRRNAISKTTCERELSH